ncbi:DNA polymerase III subunit gamma/tau [Desulfosoma caldarium]|uniref:DNA polymerase III subunit gamma/tau n=1 Tax=Desulfosoma caldarium TaxID=610254 RepID=A0A3N1UNB3_9BACT|nr:DNA polymerase III subunit gamma/tau [Desulfosoma caldarium]ROQ90879.1 DNA polymerase III tau subunit [Desulfosoma caldarium]
MSYLVLARKYRPQTFEEVVGQPHVTRTLKNAVQSGRIAHAYLFTGARGVGKTSVARILAKALNCETGVTPVPCNRCSNCSEIGQGRAVDVLEIDGASNRGIDSIRELRETIRYRPVKSAYKVYIIDEVHMLTTEAFNALLKTLEEPPAHVVFIFATTEPHKIPATILSRCQRYDFRRIPTEEIQAQLLRIAQQEGVALSASVLDAVAREADGSMRDAQSLMEQLLALRGDDQQDRELLDLLGVVDRESVLAAAEAVVRRDPAACLDVVERIYRRGMDSRRFCQRLCELFRDLMVMAFRAPSAKTPPDALGLEAERLQRLVNQTTVEDLFQYFQILVSGEEDIRRASLPRVTLEMLLLRLACLPRAESVEKILERLEQRAEGPWSPRLEQGSALPSLREPQGLEPAPGAKSAPVEAAASAGSFRQTVAEASVPEKSLDAGDSRTDFGTGPAPEDGAKQWENFCRWLEQRDPVTAAKLHKSTATATPDGLNVEILEIYEENIKNGETEKTLLQHLTQYFQGKRPNWRITFSVKKIEPQPSARARKDPVHSRSAVLRHPAVQMALEILGGELVEIRPVRPQKPARRRTGRTDKTT